MADRSVTIGPTRFVAPVGLAVFGIFVLLLPAIVYRYLPSQDGPAHVNTAFALAKLHRHSSALFEHLFARRSGPISNAIATDIMTWSAIVGPALSPYKVIWGVIATLFVGTVTLNLARVPGNALCFAPFAYLILAHGVLAQLGFVNFLVGVVVFAQTIFLIQHGLADRRPRGWAALTLLSCGLTYLAHPLAGFALGATLGSFAAAYAALAWARRRSGEQAYHLIVPIVCVLGCALLLACALWDDSSQLSRLLAASHDAGTAAAMPTALTPEATSTLVRLRRLITLTSFVSYSVVDRVVASLFGGAMAWLIVRRLRRIRQDPLKPADAWLFSVLGLAVLAIIVPPSFEQYFAHRLSTCLMLVLVLWAAAQRESSEALKAVLVLGLVLNVGALIERMTWTARINAVLEEFATIAPVIPAGATVLAVHDADLNPASCISLEQTRALLPCGFRPTLHFVGEVIGGKNIALVSNYQLRTDAGFFPLSLRSPWATYVPFIDALDNWALPDDPADTSVLLKSLRGTLQCLPPDIIVAWSDARVREQSGTRFARDLAPIVAGYRRVFTSPPLGAAVVYRREAPHRCGASASMNASLPSATASTASHRG